MKKYELTMMTTYVEHWGEYEAIREILQNAIDHGNPIIEQTANSIKIISKDVTLDPKSLLLGYTSKHGDKNMIGEFGEGYKLSCLVLARLGKTVIIHNGDHIWVPRIEYSSTYGCDLLTIEESLVNRSEDLIFEIQNIEIDLTKKYLPNMSESQILDKQEGLIYVAGLYVCQLDDFRHGYNFAAGDITLGRDRQMVSTYDVSWEIARIWNNSGRTQEVYEMLKDECKDVASMDSYNNQIGEGVAAAYVGRYGSLYPVTTQEDIEAVGGQGYQVVPKLLKVIVKKFHDFAIKMFGSPVSRLGSWKKRWGYALSEEANKELTSIIRQMGGMKDEEAQA